jgi:hypothetical protein
MLSIHDQLEYMIKACLCPSFFYLSKKKLFNALTHNVLYYTAKKIS